MDIMRRLFLLLPILFLSQLYAQDHTSNAADPNPAPAVTATGDQPAPDQQSQENPQPAKSSPYFSINVSEGLVFLGKGFPTTANSIVMDAAYIRNIDVRNSWMLLYELNYQGPGLRAQDSESLSERHQNNYMMAKYFHKLTPDVDLKFKTSFLNEFFKLSKNEAWGSGLYDYYRIGGGGEAVLRAVSPFLINATYDIHYLQFPNYTDLLSEYLGSGGETARKQTHILQQVNGKIANAAQQKYNYAAEYSLVLKTYVKSGIVLKDGLYSDRTRQFDATQLLSVSGNTVISMLYFGLTASYERQRSNLYYLNEDVNGRKLPINFNSDALTAALTTGVLFSPRNQLMLDASYMFKNYPDKVVLDASGAFVDGKTLRTSTFLASISYHYVSKTLFRFQPVYSFKLVSGNDKSEQGKVFNYAAHYLGVNLIFSY
jgi:hypothetical protein